MKRKWRPAARRLCAAGRPDIMRFVCLALLIAASASKAFPQQGIITTVAGGGPVNPVAVAADIFPNDVAVDSQGNVYIAAPYMYEILRVDPSGGLSVAAGSGIAGFSGDGGPAPSATFNYPASVAVDAQGNLFIGDVVNPISGDFSSRVRRVDALTGIITTVAGNGQLGYGGDGGPATSASLTEPYGLAVDPSGNLFIADYQNHRVRRVDAVTGIITTFAGNGTRGFRGDGGPATSASLNFPASVAVDGAGNLFIADVGNNCIRRVDAATAIITTVATMTAPLSVAVDGAGNLYVADYVANVGGVDRVDAITHTITRVAGGGTSLGDGGPATNASMMAFGVAVDGSGNLFIADSENLRVRYVDGATGIITTLAGGGSGGDGGPATSATLISPLGPTVDSLGSLFIADTGNVRVRRVDAATSIITTFAGNGLPRYSGDGGPATSASLVFPTAVALDSLGNLFIVDGPRVRRVDGAIGIISTVAGSDNWGYGGDGGPATSASFNVAFGIAVDASGNLFIADTYNNRIRRVDAATQTVTTVAGNGIMGAPGDGGPATSAHLALPWGVAVDTSGNLFVADTYNHRIRRADGATQIITTVAGILPPGDCTPPQGFSGDGGPATSAKLNRPQGVTVDSLGNLYIADTNNKRVRRVDAVSGIITTVAGNGEQGFGGDGGPATSAVLDLPSGVALDGAGNLFILDSGANRVRAVPLPPFVALSATALLFSIQPIGTTSAAQTITITNTGMVALTISGIAIAGTNADDYTQTDTCGSSVGAGANCAINVTFTPAAAGSRTATLTITDDAPGSPHTVLLNGTGQGADFSLAASPTSATVTAGQTAAYTITVSPVGGFDQSVALSCSGAPSLATCSVSPSSLTLDGTNAATATVTVTTTARSGVGMRLKPPAPPWVWLWLLALLAIVAAVCDRLAWTFDCSGALRYAGAGAVGRYGAGVALAAAMLSLTLWTACGGGGGGAGGNRGTPAGTYAMTVSGTYTSGATTVQHNVSLRLKVN